MSAVNFSSACGIQPKLATVLKPEMTSIAKLVARSKALACDCAPRARMRICSTDPMPISGEMAISTSVRFQLYTNAIITPIIAWLPNIIHMAMSAKALDEDRLTRITLLTRSRSRSQVLHVCV